MAKRKKKTKSEIETAKARRAMNERLRYWRKRGIDYQGPLPKTAQGMRNLTGKKIKAWFEREQKKKEKEQRRKDRQNREWYAPAPGQMPDLPDIDNNSPWPEGPEPVDGEPDDLGPSEEDYAEAPVDDLEEAKKFLKDIEEYIEDAYPDVTPNNRVNDYVDEVKRQLKNIIDSAKTKYGEEGLAKWIWESGAGETLYDLIGEAIQHYKMPLIYLVQIATLLNGGPLSQSQSEQLTDFGTIEFEGDLF